MNVKTYLNSLDEKQKEELARKADTSVKYLYGHLYHCRRVPGTELMKGLIKASGLTKQIWLDHFYPDEEAA